MIKAKTQFCNEFDSSMILIIKNTVRGWPDKFQDIVFKNTKAPEISDFMVKTVTLNNS